jgi:hypothetical protein
MSKTTVMITENIVTTIVTMIVTTIMTTIVITDRDIKGSAIGLGPRRTRRANARRADLG